MGGDVKKKNRRCFGNRCTLEPHPTQRKNFQTKEKKDKKNERETSKSAV